VRKKLSLETKLIILFVLSTLLLLLPCLYIIIDLQLDLLEASTLLLFFLLPGYWLFSRSYQYITDVLERVGLQLDALGNEEFNSWHLAGFHGGRIEALRHDFLRLSHKLSTKRLEYMHNESFLFDFIKDLELPIVVLDHHQQIYSSNNTFDLLLKPSTSTLLGKKISSLGIELIDNKWQQAQQSQLSKRYQIAQHILKRSGRNYQLLVLFSIEQQLRDHEKQVWQRLIRVLNHEVRNSLTPIYSMTQSLQEMKLAGPLAAEQQQIEHNILQVIEKRSLQLLDFVENYSAFNKLAPAKISKISSTELTARIQAIFPTLIIAPHKTMDLFADLGQLEQALINIIKNAIEANTLNSATTAVNMVWLQKHNNTLIKIIDSGLGIANPDNLFVPFYSTKEKGTGIGLIISREFIRNQGGELTLENRQDTQGAIAEITLLNKQE